MKRSTMALAAALAVMFAGSALAQTSPEDRSANNAGLGGTQASRIKGDAPKAKTDDKAAPAVKLDAKALDRGMKEAPAIQQASGTPCQISAAAFRGEGTQKGADGKSQKVTIYETACSGSLGYLLLAPAGAKPQAFDCLASQGAATKCELPANADPKAGLASIVTAAGKTCAVSDAKYLGTSTISGQNFYEVACGQAPGYKIAVATTGAPVASDGASLLDSANACTLTTKAQIVTALSPIAQSAGKQCQVSDVRWIGVGAKTGDTFYEFACGATPGFIAVLDNTGKLKQAVDCAKAQGIGEGCKMTDSTVAQTQETGVYTKAAAKAGYPCQVSKYRFIGMDKQNREVVELACSDHPDGALAVFADGGKSEILDCVAAGAYGQECKLSDPKLAYPKYTDALAAKGKSSCKVSGATFVGTNDKGVQYVETACSDGAPGWVIAYDAATRKATEVLSCSQATSAGAPCKLPTNVAGNKKS